MRLDLCLVSVREQSGVETNSRATFIPRVQLSVRALLACDTNLGAQAPNRGRRAWRLDQARDRSGTLASSERSGEQPILARGRPQPRPNLPLVV